jgi:hypothetical protein
VCCSGILLDLICGLNCKYGGLPLKELPLRLTSYGRSKFSTVVAPVALGFARLLLILRYINIDETKDFMADARTDHLASIVGKSAPNFGGYGDDFLQRQ